MKTLFLSLIMVILLLGTSVSAGDKKDEIKYEVKITVTYNAVSIDKARAIHNDVIKDHKDACDVKVITEKNTGGWHVRGNYLTISNTR